MHTTGGERPLPDARPDRAQPPVVLLDGATDPPLLGGKGAALGRLVAWGLPVPACAVVTTEAFRRFAAAPALVEVVDRIRRGSSVTAEEIDRAFLAAPFPDGVGTDIVRTARRVAAGGALAVRSSATVEDMAQSSFAGQYRSLLHVDPDDGEALLDAVRLVFASLWHPPAVGYRRAVGVSDDAVAMAAVLMRMVPAVRAGVVFTVDPAGDPGSARIEAVDGLADDLVSGRRTPEALVVRREGDTVPPPLDEVLRLALEIERRADLPQDVEWAWDGADTWIVQARPITTVDQVPGDGFDDDPTVLDDLDLTTAAIGETLPGVLPPLVWSLASFLVEEAFRELLSDLDVLPMDVEGGRALVRRVRGRAAMDFGRLRAMAEGLPGSAAGRLEAEYFGSGAAVLAEAEGPGRGHRPLRRLDHDRRVVELRHRAAREAATMAATAELLDDDRPAIDRMSDPELLAYHLRLVDTAVRAGTAELAVAADAAATFGRLQSVLGRVADRGVAARLSEQLLARIGVTAVPPRRASAAVFAGATWDELGLEPVRPTTTSSTEAEATRWLVVELREASGAGEESLLFRLRLRAVRRLAHESALRMSLRERAKIAVLTIGGEVRRVHLEMARRLVERGALVEVAEVDLLEVGELRAALAGRAAVAEPVLAQRRRWRTRYEQDPPLPPRFRGVPRVEVPVEGPGARLDGWAASPGRYRGRVQVVRSPLDPLEEGAVLVAEATDPSWSPLFVRAGAIVLDRGGPLSHAAILARELGVPAVLNVPGATARLAGQEVTVDGDAGVVVVHEPEAAP